MTAWHDDLKTKIIKSDLVLYKEAFELVCGRLCQLSGSSADDVKRYWLIQAAQCLETDEQKLYRKPLL